MGRIHVPRSGQGLRVTPVSPVDGHAVGNRLGEIQRDKGPGDVPDVDMQPGLSVIGDVHGAYIHGPGKCVDLLQGPVPSLEHQSIMGWTIRQGGQCLGFLQGVRGHKGSVIVIEIHVLQPRRRRRSAATRLDGPDSRRHFCWLVEGRAARLFPDSCRNVYVMGIIRSDNCHQ